MRSSEPGSSRPASGSSGKPVRLAALAAALAAAIPAPAFALWGDRAEVFAAENVTYDSNVFRLPGGGDPTSAIGSSERGDWISTTSLGLTADVPVSLQRFRAQATFFASRYRRFTDLDFNGHALRGEWLWAVTPALTGELGASDSRNLSSFSNLQVRERDIVRSTNAWGNAVWMVTPSWRVHGALGASRQDHSATSREVQDIERATGEVGLSYVTAQENRVGVAFRTEQGKRPDTLLLQGVPFDNAYDQNGVALIVHYVPTGHSTFDVRADYIKRDYDQFPSRNFKGATYTGTWTWTPTGKLTFVTTAMRDIGPLEDINTSFVLVKGVSFKPRWALTEKVTITGNLDYSSWDYRGDPLFGTNFVHHVRAAGVGAQWKPLRRVALQASLQHETRTSTLASAEYSVNVFMVEGRIGF